MSLAKPANAVKLGTGIILVVLAALMLADAIIGWINGTSTFFAGVNHDFEFIVGFAVLVIATSTMQDARTLPRLKT